MLENGQSKNEIMATTKHAIALQNVSLEVAEGETFVIMGLSGSGKSTMIRCLNRLIEPTKGEILYRDQNVLTFNREKLREFRQRTMSMVFQRFALFPHRSVLVNTAYGLEVQGVDKETRHEKAMEWLNIVGLKEWAHSHPGELSGGMQQRVGIARALCTDPEILLMDEPFSALDPLIRREMQDELVDLQSRLNKTIVFITHDLDEALRLGDRIAILKDGKVVQIGTPEDILTSPADDYVADFTRDVNRVRVLTAGTIMKKPRALRIDRGGPRVALKFMEEQGLASVFVVDEKQHLQGMLTMQDAIDAVREGSRDILPLLNTGIDITTTEAYMEELLPMAARNSWPIAVVDEEERLIGIIPRVAVLGALAGTPAMDTPSTDVIREVADNLHEAQAAQAASD
ncbi:MAG: glycine betaine/L-proline ABC transporter ATP-binding protein [Chloroflexi bacterium]|nr:glycine betaine/L-proline ABC transporter ATP-binding protein [Chloroflexota bacterium]